MGRCVNWRSCPSVLMFLLSTVCVLLQPNMVNELEEGEEEGSQEKRMEEQSKSAFSLCFGPFFELLLQEEFPLYRIFGELHLFSSGADDFSRPVQGCCTESLCFQLYCRSTARKRKLCIQHVESIWGACGIPQGSLALTRPNAGSRRGP